MEEQNERALEAVIEAISLLIDENKIKEVCTLSISHQGQVIAKGGNLFRLITAKGTSALGMNNPYLPRGVIITFMPLEEGGLSIDISDINLDGQPVNNDNGAENLMKAITEVLRNSTVTFHKDGSITGTGMGHHIAKALRRAAPGEVVYDLINSSDVLPPMHIVLADTEFRWFTSEGIINTIH